MTLSSLYCTDLALHDYFNDHLVSDDQLNSSKIIDTIISKYMKPKLCRTYSSTSSRSITHRLCFKKADTQTA